MPRLSVFPKTAASSGPAAASTSDIFFWFHNLFGWLLSLSVELNSAGRRSNRDDCTGVGADTTATVARLRAPRPRGDAEVGGAVGIRNYEITPSSVRPDWLIAMFDSGGYPPHRRRPSDI
jgi:hypothetical protein